MKKILLGHLKLEKNDIHRRCWVCDNIIYDGDRCHNSEKGPVCVSCVKLAKVDLEGSNAIMFWA